MNKDKTCIRIIIEGLYAGMILILELFFIKLILGYTLALYLSPLCILIAVSPHIMDAINYHKNKRKK